MKPVAPLSMTAASFLLIFLYGVFVSPTPGKSELLDRVVAVVNDDVITLSDLEKEGEPIYRDIAAKTPSASLAETLQAAREHVLDRLIEKRLVSQRAKAANITVSDVEIENAFQEMVGQSGLNATDFLAKLKGEGMTEAAYKEQLRGQILQSKLVNADVRSKVVVTDDEILDYYTHHYTTQVSGSGLYLLQIGVSWQDRNNPDATAEELAENKTKARQQAEKVLEMAREGEDFRALARKYSDMPSASDGGDIGFFQPDEMAPYMQQAVKELQPNEISDIIETPGAYQFFKLLNNEEGTIAVKTPLEKVKEEIRNKLYQERLKDAFDAWMNKIKNEAYIQKL